MAIPSSLEIAADQMANFLRDLLTHRHDECEDGFYSCTQAENYFGPDKGRDCTCGKKERDEHISNLILRYEQSKH